MIRSGELTHLRVEFRRLGDLLAALRPSRVIIHFDNRMIELQSTVIMLSIAAWLAIWPDAIANSSFRLILRFMGVGTMFTILAVFGALRLAALIANGRWSYGVHCRAVCATFAALIWAQLATALLDLHLTVGSTPSIGIPVYATLAAGELLSMGRALVLIRNGRIP